MFILTNMSQDVDGMVYAGTPTFFNTEAEAICNAKKQLAEDFGIGQDEIENEAQEGGTPYVLAMSRDGRFEAYTVSRIPKPEEDFYKKKSYVISQVGKGVSEDMPNEFFEHTYRAMRDYGMSVYDADKWAWLNTLFGYDIGADRALSLITWYDDNGMDVLELGADDKETVKNVAEMELGFHFNYAAFAPYTPDAISYTRPDRI